MLETKLGAANAEDATFFKSDSKAELYPYQKEGIVWLSNEKTRFKLLADEMGLGKTVQAILAADNVNARRVLVLCPAIARVNWHREVDKFSPNPKTVSVLKSGTDKILPGSDYVVCSYDLAGYKHDELLNYEPEILICDEAHYLKSKESLRCKVVLGPQGIARKSFRTWALSGTPMPNNFSEMWVWLYTFGVTPLNYKDFVKEYCTYYQFNPYTLNVTGTRLDKVPAIKELLKTHMLRRTKAGVLKDLPKINYSHLTIPESPVDLGASNTFFTWTWPVDRSKELYEKIAKQRKFVEDAVDLMRRSNEAFAALRSMAKSVATLRMYTGAQKVGEVVKLVTKEFDEKKYEKLVIFAIHKDVIDGLREGLLKFGVVVVYGGSDPIQREKNIKKFQENPSCRVFIGNILAAGTAINLTVAHDVLMVEQDWVPGNNAQAICRCSRIGQKEPVFVRFVGLENSIDDALAQALRRKTKQLTEIYGDELEALNAQEELGQTFDRIKDETNPDPEL
jgi:SNF2 family DNA or RNA helicase